MKDNPVLSNAISDKKVEDSAAGMSTMQAHIDQLEKSLEHHKKEYGDVGVTKRRNLARQWPRALDIAKYK